MKNTKKIITLALAAAMLSATGITAFAETTNVSYNVDPSYTVTIPATVDLGDTAVDAEIKAENVLLETGKQVVVALTAASNTASGSTFNAKNGDSAVTYTITGDKAIAVGDTVATFTANGSKTLTFSAADKSGATVAGAHTETLTFGIAVEDAIQSETISLIKEQNPNNPEIVTSVTSEHFKVTTGYSDIGVLGLAVNKFGAMTIESLNGENITKIELSYAWGSNANTVSVTPGTLNDAYNTISDINATKVTVSSSSIAGVRFGSVKIYYR